MKLIEKISFIANKNYLRYCVYVYFEILQIFKMEQINTTIEVIKKSFMFILIFL